ncbi:hypothetical protein K502DRAFT_353492 [Neoconidiobolus thromboides FSU 785]|nr:hypothetical protein K502DRAFT_353492 [Neoconidiobolus thromboides FSU 785]
MINSTFYKEFNYDILKKALTHEDLKPLLLESNLLIEYLECQEIELSIKQGISITLEPTGQYFKNLLNYNRDWEIFNKVKTISLNYLNQSWLFNQQYIIKSANCLNSEFKKHKDGQYLPKEYQSINNIAIYIPLQFMNKCNGGLKLYPKSRKEIDIELELGDILIMNSQLYHSSYPNLSKKYRSAFMLQFSDIEINIK